MCRDGLRSYKAVYSEFCLLDWPACRAVGVRYVHERRAGVSQAVRSSHDVGNTRVDADGEGRAKLRVKRSKIRFQVKAKDLPQGSYDLVVGDTRVAGIQLAPEDDEPDEVEGKVKFDSRRARGSVRLLTFDPLCKRLAITQTAAGTTTTFLVIE